jgi:N6-adenosine-specific RNA methylase IME4
MENEIKKNRTFDIIYLDPPWDLPFVRDFYGVLTTSQLKKLPIDQLSNKRTILFMWVVTNRLVEAIELMNHWGFYYVDTAFVWVKTTANRKLHFGLGKTSTRRASEFVLMGVRYGSPVPERKSKSIPQVFFDTVREPFSRKPDVVRKYISELFHHNSKLELFARRFADTKFTDGWTLYNRTVIQNSETEKKKKRRVDRG